MVLAAGSSEDSPYVTLLLASSGTSMSKSRLSLQLIEYDCYLECIASSSSRILDILNQRSYNHAQTCTYPLNKPITARECGLWELRT